MKLLLTSSGISNRSIAKALGDLVGNKPGEVKVGYVATASNAEEGSKDWVIKDLLNFWRYGYNWVDLIDPSMDGVDWKSRLDKVDVVALSGGNTYHLLDQIRKTGFDKWLVKNLKNKVYFGGSAGSLIFTPSIAVAGMGRFYDKNFTRSKDLTALNLVNFEIIPHLHRWPTYEDCQEYAKKSQNKVYALDDLSAIKVDGKQVEVISEGTWCLYKWLEPT